ncbi:MAG: CZB domain-containing protein [Sulfurimonas sp.]|nr:CZB domain-containing protein [Sulfurimonas sp.]
MDKAQSLEAIKNARKAHELQMKKIVALINGEEVENPTAVNKTQCDFGKWFYAEDGHLPKLLGALFYNELEVMHARWHMEYVRIFEIFFQNKKQGFFSKMIGVNRVSNMDLDRAKLYYSELEATTNELLKALAVSERRLGALNESLFI